MSEADDPARWLDDGAEVDADLLAALEATQSDFASEAQLAAVEASLLSQLGGGGGGGGGGGPSSIAPKAATVGWAGPTAAVTAGLILAAGLVALLWPEPPAEPPPPTATAPATPEPVTPPVDVTPPEPTPAPRETAAPAAAAEPATPAPRRLDEGQLLERARRLVRPRPAAALRALETHRARFPDGALAEERDALSVEALHGLGRDAEARAARERFHRRYPGSVHRVRLRALFE